MLSLLTLFGLVLRVVRLELQPLWWDEGYSVWFATHPLGQMAALTAQDIHPPLYYALLRGWTLLLGTGPVALRLFSAVIGTLAIPAIYLAGRRLVAPPAAGLAPPAAGLTPRAAWLAVLLLAINPLHIYYSQEVRMYGLVALLSVGILAAAMERRLILYVILTAAALYTQYYAAFLPVGLTVYMLWWWWRCRRAGRGAQSVMLSGLAPNTTLRRESSEASPSGIGDSSLEVHRGAFRLVNPLRVTVESVFKTVYHAAPAASAKPPWSRRPPIVSLRNICAERANVRLGNRFRVTVGTADEKEADGIRPYRHPSCGGGRRPPWHVGGAIFPGLVRPGRDREVHPCDAALVRWLAAQVAVVVLYLPWLLYAAPKLVPYVSQKVVQDADRPLGLLIYLARHLAAFLAGHLEGPVSSYWPVTLALLLPLALGGLLMARRGGEDAEARRAAVTLSRTPHAVRWACHLVTLSPCHLLATVLFTSLLLGWAVGLRYPFFPEHGERLLLLALPPFLLLAAAGLDALWARARVAGYVTLGLIIAMSGASLFGFYTVPRYPADDYRPLIARTVEQGLPEDTVFCIYPWQVGYWRSYSSPDGPRALLTPDTTWSPAVAEALDSALARGRVWFPAHLALGAVLETRVEEYLAGRAVPFANEWYGPGTRLSAWAAEAGTGQIVQIAPIRFALPGAGAHAVTLAGVTAALEPIPAANSVVPLTLTWQADAPPPILVVSVRLLDDLGQTWAQHDYEPLGSLGRVQGFSGQSTQSNDAAGPAIWQTEDRLGLLIPAGTPPGRYLVELSVWPKEEARPLEALSAESRPLGPAARLFELTVVPADRYLGPERLPIAFRRPVQMANGLRFLGYSAAETSATPGELRKISLFWQATATPSTDYVAFVQLLDRRGQVVAGWEAPPGAAYPTSRWSPGTLIRTQASFRPPATLLDGRYRLIAGLFRVSDKARLMTGQGADYLTLGYVTVTGRPHEMNSPRPARTTDVRFGEVARLVGYDLSPAAQTGLTAGGSLSLTLYWQATATTDRAYTIFVHLVDETGATRGYGDSEPGQGQLPTTSWLPGEYLADRHEVVIATDAPPGRYRLAIGLYDPATGLRLSTPTGADQVVLDVPVLVSSN